MSLFARKKANKALLLIITSFASIGYAQTNDTIKITTNQLYEKDINTIFNLPVSYANQDIKDFTHTEVYYNFKKNQFARKQTANEVSRYGFNAKGLYTTNNEVKLFGSINLEKYKEKGLAYTLDDLRSDDLEVLDPHYYFVPRASDWNNQQYHILAGAVKSFGNFDFALKASLDANKLARQTDPRPEISNRKLGGEAQIGYTFKNHQIFALGGYYVKDKDYSYYYSNTQLDNIALPETYIRFQSGFGRITNKPYNTSSIFTRTKYKKVGLGYQFMNDKTSILVNYTYNRNLENWYNKAFMDINFKKFQYLTKIHEGQIRLRQILDDKVLRSSISGYQSTSKNYDVTLSGTNYINRLRNITFNINLLKEHSNLVDYYFGAYVSYNQNRYMEKIGYFDQKVNSLMVGIYGNKDFELINSSKFNIGLAANYYTALKNTLDYMNVSGNTTNIFYENVTLYDFQYNGMDKLDVKADIRYILPVKNNKNVVVYTQLRSIFALNNYNGNLSVFNTDPTYQVNFGIQLNY